MYIGGVIGIEQLGIPLALQPKPGPQTGRRTHHIKIAEESLADQPKM